MIREKRVCKTSCHICICSVKIKDDISVHLLQCLQYQRTPGTRLDISIVRSRDAFTSSGVISFSIWKFNTFSNRKSPGLTILTVGPLWRKTWNHISFFIKLCKSLANTITGNYPAEILFCRLQCICKACYTYSHSLCSITKQTLFLSIQTFLCLFLTVFCWCHTVFCTKCRCKFVRILIANL